jgi:hypothetical protein
MSADRMQSSSQELTYPSDWIRSRPCRKVCGGPTDELGTLLGKPTRSRL